MPRPRDPCIVLIGLWRLRYVWIAQPPPESKPPAPRQIHGARLGTAVRRSALAARLGNAWQRRTGHRPDSNPAAWRLRPEAEGWRPATCREIRCFDQRL